MPEISRSISLPQKYTGHIIFYYITQFFVLFYNIKWATIKQRIKSALTAGYNVKSFHTHIIITTREIGVVKNTLFVGREHIYAMHAERSRERERKLYSSHRIGYSHYVFGMEKMHARRPTVFYNVG